MKALFDTSVLVAASVQAHPMHRCSIRWLKRVRAGEIELHVAAHSLAECYAVLTALPIRPRIAPGAAARIIRENVENNAKLVALTASEYRATIRELAKLRLAGGVVYDALVARSAAKAGVERLVTLNPDDFIRAWPEGEALIAAP